ncbi:MAG: helix-turn-helix domain-containing protein [Catonella sp.]|uniref:helix-turn-helix domain-containing protein n=1 Tax=Catonella sp. TaxID=2382125 RepID=UPI003F9FB06E
MNNIEVTLGNAIKNCRINRHFTQIELANLINKSNTTLAKYEKGEISIDVATLVEIAKVLQVPLEYFIEALKEKTEKSIPPQADLIIPQFYSSKKLYLYFWDARNNSLNTSVLKILEKTECTANCHKAEIYMNVKNVDDYIFCENAYEGTIEFHHIITNIYMKHKATPIEKITINILENFTPTDTKLGQFTGVSFRPITPLSCKMLLSIKPLKENDPVLKKLVIDKEDIKRLKTNNFFSVTQNW